MRPVLPVRRWCYKCSARRRKRHRASRDRCQGSSVGIRHDRRQDPQLIGRETAEQGHLQVRRRSRGQYVLQRHTIRQSHSLPSYCWSADRAAVDVVPTQTVTVTKTVNRWVHGIKQTRNTCARKFTNALGEYYSSFSCCCSHITINSDKKDGYSPTERASVSAISLRHILASPGYAPAGTIAVNVTWMKKRIQCLSNASQHIPIYHQPFTSYSEILVGNNCNFFLPLAFSAPVGVFPLEFRKKFCPLKTRIMGLPGSEDSLTIGWAVSTQYQRMTDRQIDVQPISITCAVWLTYIKKLILVSLKYLIFAE